LFFEVVPAILAACVSCFATGVMVKVAIPDVPDYRRKQHRLPNPTAGGVGIMLGAIFAALLPYLVIYAAWHATGAQVYEIVIAKGVAGEKAYDLLFLIAPVCVAILGFVDDKRDLSARFKLMVLIALAFGVSLWRPVTFISIGANMWIHLPFVVGVAGSILWVLVVTNCVNFMDGSNGMAMGCSALVLAAFGVMLDNTDGMRDFEVVGAGGALHFIVLGAIIGFLPWNIIGGRIFAGDTGALSVGLFLASLGLALAGGARVPIWAVALCLLPMLTDVILTVAWRALRRENVTQAHRSHAYQILLQTGLSHFQVGLIYWTLTAICCLLAVWASNPGFLEQRRPSNINFDSFLAFWGALVTLILLYSFVRRYARLHDLNETHAAE
jgi:UDP-GlcNAc:undecaprenyl-phosphate/decaprenyl-phosphate GlcNAc-1-phosphate transferase